MHCRARLAPAVRAASGAASAFDQPDQAELAPITRRLMASELGVADVPRLGGILTREQIRVLMEDLLDVLFPGLFRDGYARRSFDTTNAALARIRNRLSGCVDASLAVASEPLLQSAQLDTQRVVHEFLSALPDIRRDLIDDARAAYEGDPAARGICEVLLAYPGFLAIAAYRLAHRLQQLQVPLVPRMISEWAHSLTGIDIHPGATIGKRAFIDHGTGVVIGETAVVGDNVKLYHGVTLGAASTRVKRRAKRHPTIKDNVTLYAHATVLGGTTVVGENSVVGASVLLADTLQENTAVVAERRNLVRARA